MNNRYCAAISIILTILLVSWQGFAQQVRVDEPKVCLQCHDDFEKTLKSKRSTLRSNPASAPNAIILMPRGIRSYWKRTRATCA